MVEGLVCNDYELENQYIHELYKAPLVLRRDIISKLLQEYRITEYRCSSL